MTNSIFIWNINNDTVLLENNILEKNKNFIYISKDYLLKLKFNNKIILFLCNIFIIIYINY